MAVRDGILPPPDDGATPPDVPVDDYFKSLSIEDAREHLNTYTVEEVRRLWEAGVFGTSPVAASIPAYMIERISSGDRLE